SVGLQARAEALQRAAEQSTMTAADVERRFDALSAALAEANAQLTQLSERARGLAAAEAAAARVAALNAAVAASRQARVATAHAGYAFPADYQRLNVPAAGTFRGGSRGRLPRYGPER